MNPKVQIAKPLLVKLPLLVSTYDIDIAGHVNNIVYIRWLEDLRNLFFYKFISFENLLKKNLYPVIASTNIRYYKQIKLFDEPKGFLWLEKISRVILNFSAEFVVGNLVAASAEQRCIIYNFKESKMEKIPIEIADAYALVKNHC